MDPVDPIRRSHKDAIQAAAAAAARHMRRLVASTAKVADNNGGHFPARRDFNESPELKAKS